MKQRNSKKRGVKFTIIAFLVLIIAGSGYIYTAPEFEREKPIIQSQNNLFWNRKDPLQVELKDNIGLKSFKLSLSDGIKSIVVKEGIFEENTKEKKLLVDYPKSNILNVKAKKVTLKITVTDKSLWNLMQGNSSEKTISINMDYKRPNVNILANSYSITQGGSALVIFQAQDENLDQLYIEADGNRFKVQPYKEKGYYVALIAWPFTRDDFKARVIAIDKAKNKRRVDIPFYIKKHNYRVAWIQAKDKFIDGKITDLASNNPDYSNINDRIEKLKSINETMRLKNEELIHSLSKSLSSDTLSSWKIKKFYPLKNGKRVASFGDKRHYYYKNKNNEVSHSYHVGYDLASTKMASIRSSNAGEVVYANDNGIYGNMPMINHGLGLYTLYGHCSQILVNEGDEVHAGQIIAKTGTSGLALGDHLHFGMVVQGVEVRPVEWFDQSWIRKNIDNVFKKADKIIIGH